MRRRTLRSRTLALMLMGALSVATPARALGAERPALHEALVQALAEHPLACTGLGVVVADAASGDVLLSERADVPMAPASVMKLATSAAALKALGPDFRFHTRLYGEGSIVAGRLTGDLTLVGGADPTLSTADMREMALVLERAGVQAISGDFIVDASLVTPPAWEPGWVVDDLTEAYAPPISALVLDGNVATGSALAVPISDPVMHASEVFRAALATEGIVFSGRSRQGVLPAGSHLLADHASLPLIEVLARMNKDSLNLSAESLFRYLGTAGGSDPGTPEAGARAVTRELAALGVATSDVRVADGSGLSRYDLLTPRAIARLLVAIDRTPAASAFREGLPCAGVDGTLVHRFVSSPLRGRLHAKTGTMSAVSALAGYMDGRRGRRWVVVLMVNGFTGRVHPVQALEDAILERVSRALEAGS